MSVPQASWRGLCFVTSVMGTIGTPHLGDRVGFVGTGDFAREGRVDWGKGWSVFGGKNLCTWFRAADMVFASGRAIMTRGSGRAWNLGRHEGGNPGLPPFSVEDGLKMEVAIFLS